jgi:hypothetical protein
LYIANASAADPDDLYADALVASAVAGKYSAPLVLVDTETSDATTNAIAYIGNNGKTSDVQLIGGTGVVSENTETAINNALKGDNPDQNQASEVQSVEAVGLNQIKVTFNGEVDQDSAEDVTNYKVDGSSLTKPVDGSVESTDAVASLQDDNKSVIITLADKQDQNDDVDVTVKKGILSADKSQTVPEFTQTVTFSDTTAPTVDSVSVRGNTKLDIKFSEAVKASSISDITSKLKINDKSLSSFGLNTSGTDGNEKPLSKLDDSIKYNTSGDGYTDEVELYFDTALPTGDNTLKISDADSNVLSDAAGFPVADTTEDFTVDTLTTEPEITSITAEDSGKVYVNFDRPMDPKTATKAAYYGINGVDDEANLPSGAKAELKKGDTQVKISGVEELINKNSNKIYIKNNVKDAYGNNVADDTYKSFDLEEDTTKPTVTSVSALDDDTIRVKFSKDVDVTYAKSTSNYKLKDSDGTDITADIHDISIVGDSSASTASVFDINLNSGKKLSDSNYTLTVKNIQDKASTPNVIDEVTIPFDGSEEVNAKVDGAYRFSGDTQKIVIVFNKEMDASTLNDKDNYQYVNGNGDPKALPSGSDITVSSDNKSVTIKLPTSLTTGTSSDLSKEVKSIYAIGVKDLNGNSLQTGNNGKDLTIPTASDAATVKPTSVRVYYDGDDLKTDLTFDKSIDDDTLDSATFGWSDGTTTYSADSVNSDGSKVTLTFDADKETEATPAGSGEDKSDLTTKINKIKALGDNAKLVVSGLNDVTGLPVSISATNNVEPYSYEAAPKTVNDGTNWKVDVEASEVDVTAVFDAPIEDSSVKPSDFTFNIGGTTIDATKVDTTNADNGTIVFKFTDNDYSKFLSVASDGATLTIKPASDAKSISTVKDASGDYAYYTPSSDDTKGIELEVNGIQAQTDVNTAAAGITSFTPASAAAGTAELPVVPTGYTVAVKTTDTPAVYDTDGKIQSSGTANVVYTVTNTASGKTADTVSIPVTVTVTP